MRLGENIRTLRLDRNMSQLELAHHLGVTDRAISRWETSTVEPRMGKIQHLAEIFEVPVTTLAEGDVTPYLRSEVSRMRARVTKSTAPLYATIAAGIPLGQIPSAGEIPVPEEILAEHPRGFFLRVSGESMNRVLPNGSYAFVDPEAEVTNGDVAALNVNGHEATVKRVLRGASSVTLSPDSWDTSFRDLILDYSKPGADEVQIIGRVVWHVAPYGVRL